MSREKIMEIKGNFAKRIRMLRTETGLSQKKFGAKTGIGQQHVYFLEAGRRVPSKLLIKALASIWGIDEGWLRTGRVARKKRKMAEA